MNKAPPYKDFGNLLLEFRQRAGITQQDFARLIGSPQQTVSRWESGSSCPRDKKISLIASVLKASVDELLRAAGYFNKVTTISFDQPFPLDALSYDSFENFCTYFLEMLYQKRKAKVHRAGSQGHTQKGVDIEVIFPNKTNYIFQCKRVKQFGPKDFDKVATKHKKHATKKYLLLSRIASPETREASQLRPAWDIWDKDDISRKIRLDLSKDEQIKLVDIFFPGQHSALLGETETSPWQTVKDFFGPYEEKNKAFNRQWHLVGREEEIQEITAALSNLNNKILFIVGAAGSGKSRILKEVINTYQNTNSEILIRLLLLQQEITDKSLKDLGDNKKLLIVDDAHDIDNLQLLFRYVALPSNKARLVLALRPYGLDFIKAQANHFIVPENTSEVPLRHLSLDQATELAKQVLKEFGGHEDQAKQIAHQTLDCPLFTVIGAHIVAKEKISIERARNENLFRQTLFCRFHKVIIGDIGSKGDEELLKKLLKIIALVQPFYPDDPSLTKIVEEIESIRAYEMNRLIKLLADAGILFKRGGKYRLSPDMLADFIIEKYCIGLNGSSTGYAEQLFERSNETYCKHILLNLGKLDWRRTNGEPSNSRLLDRVWTTIRRTPEAYIPAVTATAYYQPERALQFAEAFMYEGKCLGELPELIKYISYNIKYIEHACHLLWGLGKKDARALNPHPGHAIRILLELCKIEPNKPKEYNEKVVEFSISLLGQKDSWGYSYTPFDILKSILKTSGEITYSEGINLYVSKFTVNLDSISELRNKVVDAGIQLLCHSNIKIAVLAARFLEETIRYSVSGNDREKWTKEFVKILQKIEQAVQDGGLDPLVLVEIARSVSWHAHHGPEETSVISKRIIFELLPTYLEFRTTLALVDGFNIFLLGDIEFQTRENKQNNLFEVLTNKLFLAYPNEEELRVFIELILSNIAIVFGTKNQVLTTLYDKLVQASLHFAQTTVKNALINPDSKTAQFAFVGKALSKLLYEEHENALEIANHLFDSNVQQLQAAIGRAYCHFGMMGAEYKEKDVVIIRRILASSDPDVVLNAIDALRSMAKKNQRLTIDLLKQIDIGILQIIDKILCFFGGNGLIPFEILAEEDIGYFLKKLLPLKELDGYWVETFLANASKHYAIQTAKFFRDRIERAVETQDWSYRPCNDGPYKNVPLRFRESPEFGLLLQQTSEWIRSYADSGFFFHDCVCKLFNVMFSPFDDELLGFLYEWINIATSADFCILSQILSTASDGLVFKNTSFVIHYLEKAKQCDSKCYDHAVSALYTSAAIGERIGMLGEPFAKDIQLKEESEKILQDLPRSSPAYVLYSDLKKRAEYNIGCSRQERESFEDM